MNSVPRYLMHPDGVRLVSSRNQHTGEHTSYVYVPVEPEHRSWRRRVGAGLIAVSVLGVVGLVIIAAVMS